MERTAVIHFFERDQKAALILSDFSVVYNDNFLSLSWKLNVRNVRYISLVNDKLGILRARFRLSYKVES